MYLNQYPHVSEEYYCQTCDSKLKQIDIRNNWKCPTCDNLVEIRVKTNKLDNSCFRVKVKDLEEGDMVLLNREDEFRTILNLKKEGTLIRVALERYTVIPLEQDSLIIKLHGGWYH
jgi:DNA-directed RNA polymerase subunit RPC12/RpoP